MISIEGIFQPSGSVMPRGRMRAIARTFGRASGKRRRGSAMEEQRKFPYGDQQAPYIFEHLPVSCLSF
jgi:hypothetical protein